MLVGAEAQKPPPPSLRECSFAVHDIQPIGGAESRRFGALPWHEILIRPGRTPGYSEPESFVHHLYSSRPPVDVDSEIFQRAAAWLVSCPEPKRISVNVHPESLINDDFSVEVLLWQGRAAAAGHSICLELVEFGGCSDKLRLVEAAQGLREAGVLIALDDFGSRLNCFDLCSTGIVDLIKIDTSVVSRIGESPYEHAIIQALQTLANGIGAGLVAEGIETQSQLETVRRLDVGYGQGFLLNRPELIEDI